MPRLLPTSPFADLLSGMKESGLFASYDLNVYTSSGIAEAGPCCSSPSNSLCGKVCVASLPTFFEKASREGGVAVVRCPLGLLGFVIEISREGGSRGYVVGCGVREKSLDLYRIESVSRTEGIDPFVLLEHLQKRPQASEREVHEAAAQALQLLSVRSKNLPMVQTPNLTERLRLVAAVSGSLDNATSARETLGILAEAVGMIFDVPSIAAAFTEGEEQEFKTEELWGHLFPSGPIRQEQVARVFPGGESETVVVNQDSLKELYPDASAERATCTTLVTEGTLLGVVTFFDHVFSTDDMVFLDLLAGRAALRLNRLRQERESVRRESMTTRLLAMISSLAFLDGQELLDQILMMAGELVNASTGSLMVIEEENNCLRISSAIGMSPHLLKVLNIKLGSGIAGKVAVSGHPLLVNDIERDERIATPNRPRFKTKSFISIPLIQGGRVSGVLNLSDKRNNGIFTEQDLELLTPFVNHVSVMMQRSSNQQRVELLERLSITDPLTELYNRRFLERRMEEEINRSMRNGQNLTVMLIDLDYFKTYNDICGHVAGDRALKKVARVLRASVREMDVVTRYGGEEFCILLPGTSKRESIFVAERIRRDIENELFQGEEHLPFGRLTTSIGISSFPEDGAAATGVINASDIALYEAKSAGRNRIVIFSGSDAGTVTSSAKVTPLKT